MIVLPNKKRSFGGSGAKRHCLQTAMSKLKIVCHLIQPDAFLGMDDALCEPQCKLTRKLISISKSSEDGQDHVNSDSRLGQARNFLPDLSRSLCGW